MLDCEILCWSWILVEHEAPPPPLYSSMSIFLNYCNVVFFFWKIFKPFFFCLLWGIFLIPVFKNPREPSWNSALSSQRLSESWQWTSSLTYSYSNGSTICSTVAGTNRYLLVRCKGPLCWRKTRTFLRVGVNFIHTESRPASSAC